MKKIATILLLSLFSISLNAQETPKKIILTTWDGVFVAGLLNNGEGGFFKFWWTSCKINPQTNVFFTWNGSGIKI